MYKQKVAQKVMDINSDFILNIDHSYSLSGLLQQLKEKDKYTYQHSFNVYMYSISIAKQLNLKSSELKRLGWGALLHDIGKLEVPNRILKKPGSLTELEYKKIQKHTLQGIKVLRENKILGNLKPTILEHHENFDGSGYPFGLVGKNIALHARIVRIADSFDTMISNRVYQTGLPIAEAVTELKRNSGQQFDPELIKPFIKILLD